MVNTLYPLGRAHTVMPSNEGQLQEPEFFTGQALLAIDYHHPWLIQLSVNQPSTPYATYTTSGHQARLGHKTLLMHAFVLSAFMKGSPAIYP